jgi:hypothetical protein
MLFVAVAVSCSASSDQFVGSGNTNDNARTFDSGKAPVCGNGILERGEQCDGTVQPTCAMQTMGTRPNGTVTCVRCQLDATGCQSASSPLGSGGSGMNVMGMGGGVSLGGSSGSTNGLGGAGGSGGAVGNGGTTANGNGGTTGSSGGMTGSGGAGGSTTGPLGDVNALRQVCVDTINQYRATVSGAKPLVLAAASVETCSDAGAASDAKAGVAHGSAGKCPGMAAQDTCPGWNPNQYGGAAGALKACLQSMWNEGVPPGGRDKCISDYFAGNTACFLKYGHYLNMSDPGNGTVSCGFYLMPNGSIWMNQDLGR